MASVDSILTSVGSGGCSLAVPVAALLDVDRSACFRMRKPTSGIRGVVGCRGMYSQSCHLDTFAIPRRHSLPDVRRLKARHRMANALLTDFRRRYKLAGDFSMLTRIA